MLQPALKFNYLKHHAVKWKLQLPDVLNNTLQPVI